MKKAVAAYRGLKTKVADIDESYCDRLVDFCAMIILHNSGKSA